MYIEAVTTHKYPIKNMNKSVENLLISSHDVITSINSTGLPSQNSSPNLGNGFPMESTEEILNSDRISPVSSPNLSPKPSPKSRGKRDYSRVNSDTSKESYRDKSNKSDKLDKLDKFDDSQSQDLNRSSDSAEPSRSVTDGKKEARAAERSKKKSWYNVLYPTYKSRSEDFKRIFKDVPDDERLVVDYSCALQREILVHGRLYVSQNYLCFYANIFLWETLVCLRWKEVTSMTKEKTALVIPNAIQICTGTDKFFLTSFGSRDKTYLMLFRVWQNALIGQPMSMSEMWQLVHTCYGDELGLTSDDEDYVPPSTEIEKLSTRLSAESFSEPEPCNVENLGPSMESVEFDQQIGPPVKSDTVIDPTDLSDTTESEAEKHMLKGNLRCPLICTSAHEGKLIAKATLPIHIDQLFTLLFTNSKFFLDFHTARKTTDLIQSAWTQDNQTGQKMRTISLTVSLTQTIGPRSSQVTETQIMLPCSRPGYLYCINVETVNAGIPYADSFSVLSHYCMNSISENETSLEIFCQIKYKKSVWGFVKNVIEKNCWAGLEDYFNSLIKALSVECEEGNASGGLKRKTKRRRRGVVAGVVLQSHSPDHVSTKPQSSIADIPLIHKNISVPGAKGDANMIVSWVLLIAVLCLMVINGLLYYKLWGLEEAAAYTIMDLHVLKNTPKTEEDWINLLQQQESLHNVEMKKWQRVLHTAAQLLRQTEESLTELQMSIHPTTTEKLFSVLKLNLQSPSSRSDEQVKTEL
ncbi:protein Aster-B-like [Prorops nasuta]|uniref:protein Aster-B-like n=1 Tax=Prorops nasuta TaxID=863751 RepID=UPI0034CFEF45